MSEAKTAMSTLTLDMLNAADQAGFVALLEGIYEHSPWIAHAAWPHRPFRTVPQLKYALTKVVRETDEAQQKALIRAHPELAGKAMEADTLTAESTGEQQRAGLTRCSPDELARIRKMNADYLARFYTGE